MCFSARRTLCRTTFFVLLSLLGSFMSNASAQALRLQWAHTGQGNFDDWAHVALDNSGNVVVSGAITFPGNFAGGTVAVPRDAFQDILLAKLDADGRLLWANASGGTLMDAGNSVVVDAANNIVVGGFTSPGSGFFGGPALVIRGERRDAFVAQFNASGALSWAKRGGDIFSDTTLDVALDTSGNVIAVGELSRGGDFDGTPVSAAFNGSGFVARQRASDGAVNNIALFTDAILWGVAATADGGYVIAGETRGWTDFGTVPLVSPRGLSDAFVARFDAAGAYISARVFGGAVTLGYDAAHDVAVAASGRVYVVGQYKGSMDLGAGVSLNSIAAMRDEHGDAYVICFEPDGSVCWAQSFGGSEADLAVDVDIAADGTIVVVGSVGANARIGSRRLNTNGGEDGVILRLRPDSGAVLSAMTLGGPGDDRLESVVVNASGDIFVGGFFADRIRLLGRDYTAIERDALIAKVVVAERVDDDPFEDDNTPATAAEIDDNWVFEQRCPAWLARRVADDDNCEGIFADGAIRNSAGELVGPPKGSEMAWTQTITGRTLTDTADFFRVSFPTPLPIEECGNTQAQDPGPAGRDNTVNINWTGRFTAKLVPVLAADASGGVSENEPMLLYRGTTAEPTLFNRTAGVWRVDCPQDVHGLANITFSVGEGRMRDDFARGAYNIELEYVIEIERGIPDWAHEFGRFLGLGLLPDFAGSLPDNIFDLQRNFPSRIIDNLQNCIADGPGCWELFTLHWPGGDAPLNIDLSHSPGMQFQLLDAAQNLIAEQQGLQQSPQQNLQQSFAALNSVQRSALSVAALPAGTYYLAVGGQPGHYAMSYQGVAAMPALDDVTQPAFNPALLIGLLIVLVIFLIGLAIRNNTEN